MINNEMQAGNGVWSQRLWPWAALGAGALFAGFAWHKKRRGDAVRRSVNKDLDERVESTMDASDASAKY